MLHVAGGAVWFRVRGVVTRGAGGSGGRAIDGVEGLVATVAGETSFGVAFDPGNYFHTLIVQRVELIATPFLI